jgi:hypothetical protein
MAISKLNPIEGGIPKGNTSNRSTEFPSPAVGDVYYNGELEILEIWNGTSWVAVSAPPATPSIATPTDASTADAYTSTAGKLSVVFTPGSGGGTPNQYNAYTTSGGHSGFNATSTVVISGLTPGTAYTVYGNAQNNFGTTVNTANAAAVTPTTLPQTPTIGTATASSSANEVAVTWTNGATGGKALSAITITPYLNGTTAETSRTAATTSSTSYTFTSGQLTAGASYTFKVKATNANGVSLESSASNSATMPSLVPLTYLVVGGGGGGGGSTPSAVTGGGGGAGGFRTGSLTLLKNTNYTVTVGAGGPGVYTARGTSGAASVFSTISSAGGGGGGGPTPNQAGLSGGSGGGSCGWNTGTITGGAGNTPSTSPSQGNNGGTGGEPLNGAGGGGAGAVGENANNGSVAGAGGAGSISTITGTSITYAGGGGGGAGITSGKTGGPGGAGGGGKGGDATSTPSGTNGTSNTGGGGGGTGMLYPPGTNNTGANGGSGIVIVRWLTIDGSITVGAGITADSTSADGSYSYKKFTDGSGNVSWS